MPLNRLFADIIPPSGSASSVGLIWLQIVCTFRHLFHGHPSTRTLLIPHGFSCIMLHDIMSTSQVSYRVSNAIPRPRSLIIRPDQMRSWRPYHAVYRAVSRRGGYLSVSSPHPFYGRPRMLQMPFKRHYRPELGHLITTPKKQSLKPYKIELRIGRGSIRAGVRSKTHLPSWNTVRYAGNIDDNYKMDKGSEQSKGYLSTVCRNVAQTVIP